MIKSKVFTILACPIPEKATRGEIIQYLALHYLNHTFRSSNITRETTCRHYWLLCQLNITEHLNCLHFLNKFILAPSGNFVGCGNFYFELLPSCHCFAAVYALRVVVSTVEIRQHRHDSDWKLVKLIFLRHCLWTSEECPSPYICKTLILSEISSL